MKRSIFIVASILLISAGNFSACKEKEDAIKAYSAKEVRFDINETEFVTMQVLPKNGFIHSPAELILENHTKGVLTYGTPFSFEYLNKNNWESIPLLEVAWENILLGIGAGETSKGWLNFSLIEKYNKGKKGKYRIGRRYGLYYNSFAEIVSSFNLYIEFEIK